MKVEIRDGGVRGGAGHARQWPSGWLHTRARHWLDSTTIIEAGTTEVVWPEDGERYLRALPRALRGAYTAAVLVEPGDEARAALPLSFQTDRPTHCVISYLQSPC